jgi:hypothetical protein
MNYKKMTAALLIAAMAVPAGACSNKTEETEEQTSPEAVVTVENVETTAETTALSPETAETTAAPELSDLLYDPSSPYAVNPITGMQTKDPANEGQRSVAVVINNSHAAIPQRGISAADAIYEYQTEGGQTRLLAVFADVNTIPEIGSLRSARILSTDLAAGNNSVFIHFGRNARVPDHIASYGIDHIDGNSLNNSPRNLRAIPRPINDRDGGFMRKLRNRGINVADYETSFILKGYERMAKWRAGHTEYRYKRLDHEDLLQIFLGKENQL